MLRSLPLATPPADAATSAPLRLRSASILRPPSSSGTHRRGSTPSARLRRILPQSSRHRLRSIALQVFRLIRRRLPPLPGGLRIHRYTPAPLHRSVTDCYPSFQVKPQQRQPTAERLLRSCLTPGRTAPACNATRRKLRSVRASLRRATGYPSFQSNFPPKRRTNPPRYVPAADCSLSHVLFRYRFGQRLRSCLSSAFPYAIAPQPAPSVTDCSGHYAIPVRIGLFVSRPKGTRLPHPFGASTSSALSRYVRCSTTQRPEAARVPPLTRTMSDYVQHCVVFLADATLALHNRHCAFPRPHRIGPPTRRTNTPQRPCTPFGRLASLGGYRVSPRPRPGPSRF